MRLLAVALPFLLALMAIGCTPSHPQSTFDISGPVARSQLSLFYWIFWAAVFVFVTVGGALLYIVLRYRRRPGDQDPEQIHGHTKLEIGWTILPAIVLAVVSVPTVITIFDNANSSLPVERGGMKVDVTAHQWWWEFAYQHPEDPGTKVVTANELHIPVNEVINITLTSKDVIHSFWVPRLAGKVDVVPNRKNTMWLRADEAGEFLGQCAEFCGTAHALMRFRVIAEPRAEFDAWLQGQAQVAFEPTEPLAVEGKNLFEGRQAGCGSCHTVAGSKRAVGTVGPNLSHLASRRHIAAGLIQNTQANLRKWVTDPDSVKPGTIMARNAQIYNDPEKRLTKSQISALVAYLQSLR